MCLYFCVQGQPVFQRDRTGSQSSKQELPQGAEGLQDAGERQGAGQKGSRARPVGRAGGLSGGGAKGAILLQYSVKNGKLG